MPQKILDPKTYPVLRIPIFSGGASGERYCWEHDPNYGRAYISPFGIATEEGTSGQEYLEKEGKKVFIHTREEESFTKWTNGLLDIIKKNLPPGCTMEEILILLTGCDNLVKGKRAEKLIGPRKINVHPAPLYILTDEETRNSIIDVRGWDPEIVNEHYIKRGHVRRYVGWGEDIMPDLVKEIGAGAYGAATTHIATEETDHGPNIAMKHKAILPKHLKNPKQFQDELKEEGDGPTIVAATHMLLNGLEIEGETLYRRGKPLPYQGLELKENWQEQLGIK